MGSQTSACAERDLAQAAARKVGRSWDWDVTYQKVKGRGVYLYRAIDRDGSLVDVLLGERQDQAAAEAFFRSARTVTDRVLDRVTTDGHSSNLGAIRVELGKQCGIGGATI